MTLLILFIRFLPMISIFEMRTLVPAATLSHDFDEVDSEHKPDASHI